jgi:hypothetical protein
MKQIYHPIAAAIFIASICISAIANEPKEVAIGTLSCKAEWNEYCEDQNTVSVPEGHKLCSHAITVTQQTGDSAYSLVSTDAKSITIKFSAKGNRDRFKQQSANIMLRVSLLGVRDDNECVPGSAVKPSPTPKYEPKPEPPAETTATTSQAAPEVKVAPAQEVIVNAPPKVHACACSQWIDAGKLTNCLEQGHARDNVSCETFVATIQCVSSRDECRAIQQDSCYQVMGLNQTTSQKRIYVADSPYCQALIKK